jgi:hypothetical protein
MKTKIMLLDDDAKEVVTYDLPPKLAMMKFMDANNLSCRMVYVGYGVYTIVTNAGWYMTRSA